MENEKKVWDILENYYGDGWLGPTLDLVQKIVESLSLPSVMVCQAKKVDKETRESQGAQLGDAYEYYDCQHCSKLIEVSMFDNFCPKCGGKLDWSD